MQMFENLPWYGYIILVVGLGSYVVRYFLKAKEGYVEPDVMNARFKSNAESNLNKDQLFSLALDAVTNAWWKVDDNTLEFKKGIRAKNYIEGWGINTPDGYWDMTNYFMKDGRRWYFDFILNILKTEPEEKWDNLVEEKFGENERAMRYLNFLRSNTAQNTLKSKGFITFDTEIEVGVVGYDCSVLVGHARRAYTYGVITEEEAWKVINFASQLAKDTFSSWEDYGKSYILGFTLDIRDRKDGFLDETYQLTKQVMEKPNSPWNTINW